MSLDEQDPVREHRRRGKRRRVRRKAADTVPQYVDASEFARRLGISRVTMWRLLRKGKVRYLKLSKTLVRIPLSEFERLEALSHRRSLGIELAAADTTTTIT